MLDDTAIRDLAVMLVKARHKDALPIDILHEKFIDYYKDIFDWASSYGEHPPQDETDL